MRAGIGPGIACGGTLKILIAWPEVNSPLRVIRPAETHSVRRQVDRELIRENSEWMWVTTLLQAQASTARVLSLGHQRWDIENHTFLTLNVKPRIRRGKTELNWGRLVAAELYDGTARFASGSSP